MLGWEQMKKRQRWNAGRRSLTTPSTKLFLCVMNKAPPVRRVGRCKKPATEESEGPPLSPSDVAALFAPPEEAVVTNNFGDTSQYVRRATREMVEGFSAS